MSFFMKGKRRHNEKDVKQRHVRKKSGESKEKSKAQFDEEIESDSDIDGEGQKKEEELSEEEVETAQEKKLRLTKQYLAQLQQEEASKQETEDIDRDAISHRLQQDLLEQSGKIQKRIADTLLEPPPEDIRVLRGHNLSVTCLVISPDDKYIYSGSKDCSIIKWSVETGRKVHTIPGGRKGTEKTHIGHTTHVLCLAISSDNAFLASGDRSCLIHVWKPSDCSLLHTFKGHRDAVSSIKNDETLASGDRSCLIHIWKPSDCSLLHTFKGHRDAVSGLSFRQDSHQLFSGSHDRSVRVWNLDEWAFIETLYGHQDTITDLDCLARDRAVTSGGRDGSVRVWKILEESQLVFNGHKGCIDCVSLINEQNFVTGGDDNCLLLWNVSKKKALHTRTNAHATKSTSCDNWISAVCAMKYTDLIASGSKDGQVKLWKCHEGMRQLEHIASIPVAGFVNSLQFSKSGEFLVIGVGQEHKNGRWWRLKEAKNSVQIVKLSYKKPS